MLVPGGSGVVLVIRRQRNVARMRVAVGAAACSCRRHCSAASGGSITRQLGRCRSGAGTRSFVERWRAGCSPGSRQAGAVVRLSSTVIGAPRGRRSVAHCCGRTARAAAGLLAKHWWRRGCCCRAASKYARCGRAGGWLGSCCAEGRRSAGRGTPRHWRRRLVKLRDGAGRCRGGRRSRCLRRVCGCSGGLATPQPRAGCCRARKIR